MSNIREVHPQEERLPAGLPFDVVDGAVANIDVDRSRAFLGQRDCVADGLLTDPAEARVECRTIPVGRGPRAYS
jgi:hypothetical protein